MAYILFKNLVACDKSLKNRDKSFLIDYLFNRIFIVNPLPKNVTSITFFIIYMVVKY